MAAAAKDPQAPLAYKLIGRSEREPQNTSRAGKQRALLAHQGYGFSAPATVMPANPFP